MTPAIFRRILAALRPAKPTPGLDAIIARRSARVTNRDHAKAAAYRRTHTILSEGRK